MFHGRGLRDHVHHHWNGPGQRRVRFWWKEGSVLVKVKCQFLPVYHRIRNQLLRCFSLSRDLSHDRITWSCHMILHMINCGSSCRYQYISGCPVGDWYDAFITYLFIPGPRLNLRHRNINELFSHWGSYSSWPYFLWNFCLDCFNQSKDQRVATTERERGEMRCNTETSQQVTSEHK